MVEDTSKTTGKFKPVEIQKDILEKVDSKFKHDFQFFSVVVGGKCKANSNWIKKNEELVCIKCEGDFCKEFNPTTGLTIEDLKNPFFKNFISYTSR
jgi:hypothetical protein